MSYVKSVPLKKLFQYTQDDDEVVLLASENEQPEDADLFKDVVLNSLQGEAGDDTRIGAEYMPESIELDYITLGNYAGGTLPEGTLARVGSSLRMADSNGDLVMPFSVGAQEYPYGRFVGGRGLEVFEVDGVTPKSNVKFAKNATTYYYYAEIGRFTAPNGVFVDGKNVSLTAFVRATADASVGPLYRNIFLIPRSVWEVDPQSLYWGETPTSAATFGTPSPGYMRTQVFGSNSQETISNICRIHPVTASTDKVSVGLSSVSKVWGVDLTALATQKTNVDNAADLAALKTATSAAIAAQSTSVVGQTSGVSTADPFGTDIEFVVVAQMGLGGSTVNRTIFADITLAYHP